MSESTSPGERPAGAQPVSTLPQVGGGQTGREPAVQPQVSGSGGGMAGQELRRWLLQGDSLGEQHG